MIVYALGIGDVLRGPPVLGDNCPSYCIGDPIRIYRLESRPVRVGPVVTALTPLAFTDRVAVLILPPRLHRHLCEGVLASNAPPAGSPRPLGADQAVPRARSL
jgi:hypothetical protein